ncbi:MAG: glycosyltransferase family 39 protein [Candidatus Levybacteria bacterium]|nr:glycosyltransferase family 39 protein [Candidatus Levybacteria bacterium]
MDLVKRFIPYILIIIISFLAFKPLLTSGFFPIHDDTQVARVFEMTKALTDGMFPVRWSSDLGFGFGYPIFNFYAPFAYYVGGFINLFIQDALVSTKLMMILAISLSGVSMFIFARQFFGKIGGLVSCLLYLFAPYNALNIYVRGDVAEFYAYAIAPLVFWGLYKVSKEKDFKYIFVTSISFALVIISHNLTAFMLTPFLIMFALFTVFRERESIKRILVSFVLGLLLSSFYFIPALLEMNYTNVISQVGGGADFRDHFVCFSQLWSSLWGYGGSAKGCVDGLSFMVGKTHIVLFLISLIAVAVLFFIKKTIFEKDMENIFYILVFFLFSAFSIFLMLDLSKFIWELLKPMAFFQYPWRFLIITTFSLSFISGSFIWLLNKFIKGSYLITVGLVLLVIILFLNLKFFTPQYINTKTAKDYTNTETIKWNISNITSEYMPKGFSKPKQFSEIANIDSIKNEDLEVISQEQKTQLIKLNVNSKRQQSIIYPLAYFPAWKGYVNQESVNVIENKKGIEIRVPKGESQILLKYESTTVENLANLLSLAGIITLIAGIIYSRKAYGKV